MKSFLYTCLILFNVFQCQIKPMYKNLICAGGWYELEDLKIYPNLIPTESDFSPIRIFIDYTKFDSQCENDNSLNDICSFQDVIKQQLTKAGNLIEQIINVKRFSQNLIFNDDFMKQNLGVSDYDKNLNNGIPYDYVILLKIESHTEVSKKILGFQSDPVIIESGTNRPIYGIINIFNNDYTHMENVDYFLLNSFLHQIIHLLVFHPKLILKFPSGSNTYKDDQDYTRTKRFRYITSNKVMEYAKIHFDDDELIGMALDYNADLEKSMFHWHQRFMLGDLMVGDLYQEQVLSDMTLALFEDSTWYKVNYYTGGLFRFGKSKSSYFTYSYCINKNNLYRFPNDFCEEENQRRCTPGHLAKGYCKFYTDAVPYPYNYWPNNSTKGGIRSMDYCPIAEREDYKLGTMYNFYPGSCKVGLIEKEGLAEVMSDNSFCTVSTVFSSDEDENNYSYNQRGACYPMFCTDNSLTVQIGNFYFVCNKNGGIIHMPSISGFRGNFECPHYNTICTGTVLCNNIEDCINKKSESKKSSYSYEGISYEFQSLTSKPIYQEQPLEGEGAENGKCGKNCAYCKEGNSCLKCRDGEYSIGTENSDLNDNMNLFCDLTSNFEDGFYGENNGIYYPINSVAVELTYQKVYDLKFNNNKWKFKIKVSSSSLNNNDEIKVDVKLNDINRKANCVMNIISDENILNCEIIYDKQFINDKIKLIKNEKNKRIVWTDLPEEINLYIEYKIKFNNIFGGFYNGQWTFNIYHEINEETQEQIYGANVLLDILVNNVETTALCKVTERSFLKCFYDKDNQNKNDVIKIIGNTEPNLGSVYFLEKLSDEQKIIKPVTLYINYENCEINKNILNLKIRGKLSKEIDYPIEEETITGIEIIKIKNEKEEKSEVSCLTNYISKEINSDVILNCPFQVIDGEKLEINIDNNGLSKYVHFNVINNIEINKIEEEEENNEEEAEDTTKIITENYINYHEETEKEIKITDTITNKIENNNKTKYDTENNSYLIKSQFNYFNLMIIQIILYIFLFDYI